MTDLDPAAFALDTALIPEQEPTPTDLTDPLVAGELDPDQSADVSVIDPDTGEDTDDQEDPDDNDENTDATDEAGD